MRGEAVDDDGRGELQAGVDDCDRGRHVQLDDQHYERDWDSIDAYRRGKSLSLPLLFLDLPLMRGAAGRHGTDGWSTLNETQRLGCRQRS